MITDNQVYTYVKTEIQTSHEGIFITGSRIYSTEKFPTASIVCIDSTPVSETINLEETNRRSTFDVNVYSNINLTEARAILEDIRSAFKECGYHCNVFEPLDNEFDLNIKRYVGRFTRVIGEGDVLASESTNTTPDNQNDGNNND